MDIGHLVHHEPDKTDESSRPAWLFFGPFCLEVNDNNILAGGITIL